MKNGFCSTFAQYFPNFLLASSGAEVLNIKLKAFNFMLKTSAPNDANKKMVKYCAEPQTYENMIKKVDRSNKILLFLF